VVVLGLLLGDTIPQTNRCPMQNKPAYHTLRGTFGSGKADAQEYFWECPDVITPYLPPFGVVCGTVKDGKSMEGALVSTIF
jgi:hypothetical protein